jgi:hypothetical protein
MSAVERSCASAGLGYRFVHATTPAAQAAVWTLREAALGLSMAMKGDAKSLSFVEDTAVPPERLRDYIERFLAIVTRHGTSAGIYAHASVGCLHVRPVVNMKSEAGVRTFEAIANEVADLVLEYGGALSGEHGDGLVRSPFMRKMFGADLYDAFRTIKRTFDPHGLFNPGKIVDAPPLTDNLRYGPRYAVRQPATYFDYSAMAVWPARFEMCSGLGVCRKTLEGTMCPSYMATRDEQHTTRGRADVLRLTMAGGSTKPAWRQRRLRDTGPLPRVPGLQGGVSGGRRRRRFKSEFLADYWKRHGTPLGARLLGNAGRVATWGSRFAPLANWLAGTSIGRAINEQLFGIDRRRTVPAFQRQTLRDTMGDRHSPADALLFVDTFTNHYDPDIGRAAINVLAAAGVRTALASNGCCGRSQISKGLLDDARALAARNADLLYPDARLESRSCSANPAVFPPCAKTPRSAARRSPAQGAGCRRGQRAVRRIRRPARRRVATGQRTGHDSAARPLSSAVDGARRRIAPAPVRHPGASVTDLDAGCCGMAGSFGYERRHYEVSRAIAERKLLPAVRNRPADRWLSRPARRAGTRFTTSPTLRRFIQRYCSIRCWWTKGISSKCSRGVPSVPWSSS